MRIIKILIGLFFLIIIWLYISNEYILPWEKKEVIQTTLEWGGLDKLPNEIENIKIDKRGSFFTRQFIIEFEVHDSDKIEDWIKKSKRLKDNTPKLKGDTKIYEIYPGENDSYGGEVEVLGKKVRIDMSWS